MLKQNEGMPDRIIRIVLAVILGYLVISGTLTGTLAIILGIVAVIALVTGIIGWCGIYALLKISTK